MLIDMPDFLVIIFAVTDGYTGFLSVPVYQFLYCIRFWYALGDADLGMTVGVLEFHQHVS